jgi:hypothetical protein
MKKNNAVACGGSRLHEATAQILTMLMGAPPLSRLAHTTRYRYIQAFGEESRLPYLLGDLTRLDERAMCHDQSSCPLRYSPTSREKRYSRQRKR